MPGPGGQQACLALLKRQTCRAYSLQRPQAYLCCSGDPISWLEPAHDNPKRFEGACIQRMHVPAREFMTLNRHVTSGWLVGTVLRQCAECCVAAETWFDTIAMHAG